VERRGEGRRKEEGGGQEGEKGLNQKNLGK
jgi:hypothetical protein